MSMGTQSLGGLEVILCFPYKLAYFYFPSAMSIFLEAYFRDKVKNETKNQSLRFPNFGSNSLNL